MFVVYILAVIAALFGINNILNYFRSDSFLILRTWIAVPVIILWVYTLIAWSKHDKNISRFFMLFFCIGLYTPFYYCKMVKNKWI